MKIAHSLYELKALNGLKSRRGALLKVHFGDGKIGYADCHPWVEFSDEPLERQLELLKNGQTTALTKRSLYFAELDAKARQAELSLLQNLKIPPSNYLITDLTDTQLEVKISQALDDGFNTFKIKLGADIDNELRILKERFPKNAILRLDFNSKLSHESFRKAINRLNSLSIEYVEDPFPFDEKAWTDIQAHDGLTLASDLNHTQALDKPYAAKVLIVKPATANDIQIKSQKIVVTSYLDHPFGQCTAAYIAAKYQDTTCGLLTHHQYTPNIFSEQLTLKGPAFKTPAGYGFGFDTQLTTLNWIPL